jgi:hypothetical protein
MTDPGPQVPEGGAVGEAHKPENPGRVGDDRTWTIRDVVQSTIKRQPWQEDWPECPHCSDPISPEVVTGQHFHRGDCLRNVRRQRDALADRLASVEGEREEAERLALSPEQLRRVKALRRRAGQDDSDELAELEGRYALALQRVHELEDGASPRGPVAQGSSVHVATLIDGLRSDVDELRDHLYHGYRLLSNMDPNHRLQRPNDNWAWQALDYLRAAVSDSYEPRTAGTQAERDSAKPVDQTTGPVPEGEGAEGIAATISQLYTEHGEPVDPVALVNHVLHRAASSLGAGSPGLTPEEAYVLVHGVIGPADTPAEVLDAAEALHDQAMEKLRAIAALSAPRDTRGRADGV